MMEAFPLSPFTGPAAKPRLWSTSTNKVETSQEEEEENPSTVLIASQNEFNCAQFSKTHSILTSFSKLIKSDSLTQIHSILLFPQNHSIKHFSKMKSIPLEVPKIYFKFTLKFPPPPKIHILWISKNASSFTCRFPTCIQFHLQVLNTHPVSPTGSQHASSSTSKFPQFISFHLQCSSSKQLNFLLFILTYCQNSTEIPLHILMQLHTI
jgi:hypothetical protein